MQNAFGGARAHGDKVDQVRANEAFEMEFSNDSTMELAATTEHAIAARDTARHVSGRDVTAGELYSSIEEYMEAYVDSLNLKYRRISNSN